MRRGLPWLGIALGTGPGWGSGGFCEQVAHLRPVRHGILASGGALGEPAAGLGLHRLQRRELRPKRRHVLRLREDEG